MRQFMYDTTLVLSKISLSNFKSFLLANFMGKDIIGGRTFLDPLGITLFLIDILVTSFSNFSLGKWFPQEMGYLLFSIPLFCMAHIQ